MLYLAFKFLHVIAVVIWLGGVTTVAILYMRTARTGERPLMMALERQSEFVGSRVAGRAAGITLLTGFAAMGVGRIGFPFWLWWGLIVIILSMAMGGTVLRRSGIELSRRMEAGASDAEIAPIQRKLARPGGLNLLLLFSVVAVMVFKPTL